MTTATPRVGTTHEATASSYTDEMVLSLPAATGRPAIEWARAVIEGAVLPIRLALPPGWRVLGLGLGSTHAPDRVHGWPVLVDRPDEVVLGAPSRLGFEARLTVTVDGTTVRFATAIRHRGRLSRELWRGLGLPHRVIVGSMLRSAAGRVRD